MKDDLPRRKQDARRRLKAVRADVFGKAERSERIAAHLLADPLWTETAAVALFCALPEEADPAALALAADAAGVAVAYPRVEGDELTFRVAPSSELVAVPPFGVREPGPQHSALETFSLIVTPGLGFTAAGDRLGYGRGFYDRALRRLRAANPGVRVIGFGFEAQIVPELPVGAFDERLDGVVTEAGLRWVPS